MHQKCYFVFGQINDFWKSVRQVVSKLFRSFRQKCAFFSSIVLHRGGSEFALLCYTSVKAYLGTRCHMCHKFSCCIPGCYPPPLRHNNNIEVRKMKFGLLILAWIATFSAANPDVQEVFDPHSGEESYQRRYVISVLNKAEDCYYIPEVRTNQIINFHFVVSLFFFRSRAFTLF